MRGLTRKKANDLSIHNPATQTNDDADLEEDQIAEESEKPRHVFKQPSCKRSILFLELTYAKP
jgi:hypothetical protein